MEKTEKLIVGAFATVVGFSLVGNCSKSRANNEVADWKIRTAPRGSSISKMSATRFVPMNRWWNSSNA